MARRARGFVNVLGGTLGPDVSRGVAWQKVPEDVSPGEAAVTHCCTSCTGVERKYEEGQASTSGRRERLMTSYGGAHNASADEFAGLHPLSISSTHAEEGRGEFRALAT